MTTVTEKLKIFGMKKFLSYIDADYANNFPKALAWVERLDITGENKAVYKLLRDAFTDPTNNWNIFTKHIYNDLDAHNRRKFVENFVIYSSIIGNKKRKELRVKEDCNIPWAILMDPTSACNLKCTGCWAAEYGNKMSMDFDTLDSIINQGKALGIYMYIYSGGEPLVRKDDVIKLCRKHDDCFFMAFTNGTLIDEKFADQMLEVGNFIPAISIEGTEEANDARRGEGCYKAVRRAMEILKERKLGFGFSTCYTSQNAEVVGSEEFIDDMVNAGCLYGWYFTYMPVGKEAHTDLLATAEQRKYMYDQIRKFRGEKSIFLMDFWNDGEYVNGCIAGGRNYLHINANGDVEPCAFVHYSNLNINEVSLLEALKSPLFQQYRQSQPFNKNQLRPCPLLDNQGKLAEMVKASGAHSTDLACPEDVDELTSKCKDVADKWAVKSQEIWENSPNGKKAIAIEALENEKAASK